MGNLFFEYSLLSEISLLFHTLIKISRLISKLTYHVKKKEVFAFTKSVENHSAVSKKKIKLKFIKKKLAFLKKNADNWFNGRLVQPIFKGETLWI